MPRLHLAGGEIKSIPEEQPILITGWLIAASGTADATLTGSDVDGDILPVNGLTVPAFEWMGANLKIPANPTATFELTGAGASATIYYEVGKYVFEMPY